MKISFLPVLFCLISTGIFSQSVHLEDYNRAVQFLPSNISNKVYHLEVRPNWLEDSTGFWYVTNMPEGKTFFKLEFSNLEKKPAFDHQKMADAFSHYFEDPVSEAGNLPFNRIKFRHRDTLEVFHKSKTLLISLSDYHIKEIESENFGPSEEFISPDKKWIAYVQDYNLYVKSTTGQEVIQLSFDGHKMYAYGSYYGWADVIRGEDGERKSNFNIEWSPDSRKIKTLITDFSKANKMYLLDWSIDSLYRPDLMYYYRGSPGDTSLVYEIPVIVDINEKSIVKLDIPPVPHFMSSYFSWTKDSKKLYGRYGHRGFKRLDFLEFDPETGHKRIIYSDSSDTNVELFNTLEVSEKLHKILFASERSGWNQLYSSDWNTGRVLPVTEGNYYFNEILHIDEDKQWIYFSAMGKEPNRNPYFIHIYKIKMNGSKLTLLTPEYANHNVYFDPTGNYFIDNYSSLNVPTKSVVRNTGNGKILYDLGDCDISELIELSWPMPEPFEAIARDGITKIYGAYWKPSNFDSTKIYPVIENSYTGPHYSIFPKSFDQTIRNSGRQALAELGFIVVVIDGLGSAQRSKEFHNWSYKKLGYNLEDHMLAIKQLGKRNPWIDTTRVGIYGHSAGGYDAAHALLQFPDFYKVAVASSADHDHRMEKAWWPEMYMGWPVDSAYHLQSNITMAGNLKGNLLITHGGIDENVNPSATFKLAEALIKADKNFDMLILPSQRHGYTGAYNAYFTKKKWNYFVEHLLQTTPIWDFKW